MQMKKYGINFFYNKIKETIALNENIFLISYIGGYKLDFVYKFIKVDIEENIIYMYMNNETESNYIALDFNEVYKIICLPEIQDSFLIQFISGIKIEIYF